MIQLVILFIIYLSLDAKMTDFRIRPDNLDTDSYMNLTILDAKELEFNNFKDIKFREISDLAYKHNKLYAISDKGDLFKFKIKIKKDKIKNLDLENVVNLKNKRGNRFSKVDRDSEGLDFVGEKLVISFEKNPRIAIFSLHGKELKKITINKRLRDIDDYISHNKALESVAYNKKFSFITAPEVPLNDKNHHIIYSKKRSWKFDINGNITALEFINKDKVLILERNFNYFTRDRETILSIINLSKCKKKLCKKRIVAILKSCDGWHIDNFEGLTKVAKNKFLMISDDNESFFQKTLLVLFKLDI